jgi:NitT/TauT family transport system ATP-binding protein
VGGFPHDEAARVSASAAAPVLQVRDLDFTVGALEILRGISMEVREREFVCIVGASGCGKTTLLRMMAGLLTPTAGGVSYRGTPVTGPRPDIAVVFQDYGRALLPWRTVAGNVELALESRRIPRSERPAIIQDMLARVGLADRKDAFPTQLSGGMQQRLQIARCMAQAPQVLLMDEPFGALDAMTRQSLQDEVARLCADAGVTVVFITHDLEEAIYLGDRVIAMDRQPGRLSETLDIALERPRNQLTTREDARFLAYRHRLFNLLPPH